MRRALSGPPSPKLTLIPSAFSGQSVGPARPAGQKPYHTTGEICCRSLPVPQPTIKAAVHDANSLPCNVTSHARTFSSERTFRRMPRNEADFGFGTLRRLSPERLGYSLRNVHAADFFLPAHIGPRGRDSATRKGLCGAPDIGKVIAGTSSRPLNWGK